MNKKSPNIYSSTFFLLVANGKIHLRVNFSLNHIFNLYSNFDIFREIVYNPYSFLVPALILKIQKIPKNSPKEGLIGRGQRILVQG